MSVNAVPAQNNNFIIRSTNQGLIYDGNNGYSINPNLMTNKEYNI